LTTAINAINPNIICVLFFSPNGQVPHVGKILGMYKGEEEQMWSDFKYRYGGLDPRDSLSAGLQELCRIEEQTPVEVLEVMDQLVASLQ
jgi:hypothetical protein